MSDVGFREALEPAARACDVHGVTRNPKSEIRNPKSEILFLLSPVPAMQTVPATVRFPARRNPDRTRPRRPNPVTAYPVPITAAPVPESVHPNMPGTGRETHAANRSGRRWRTPHGE